MNKFWCSREVEYIRKDLLESFLRLIQKKKKLTSVAEYNGS
jgi:hypothetical protein